MTSSSRGYTSGWVIFAATMVSIIGALNVFYGLVLLFNSEWVALTLDGIMFWDSTAWGWILLIVGILELVVAWGVLSGQTWARVVAIIIAAINLIGLFPLFGLYPLWNLTLAILLVLVIYGLAVHGEEVA